MAIKKTAPEPAPIVVSLTCGFADVDGVVYDFSRGDRIRADHPLAKAHPAFFIADGDLDGMTSSELHQHKVDTGTADVNY